MGIFDIMKGLLTKNNVTPAMDEHNSNISKKGIALLKAFEGYSNKRYKDVAGLDTIGVGHLIISPIDRRLTSMGLNNKVTELTDAQVDMLFEIDLQVYVEELNDIIDSNDITGISQRLYDVLVSFMFNIGIGNFRSSTLLKLLIKGDLDGALDQLLVWNKATNPKTKLKVVVKGLDIRRRAEYIIGGGKGIKGMAPELSLVRIYDEI